jgi:membrane protein DedA with SNARE-associated domain
VFVLANRLVLLLGDVLHALEGSDGAATFLWLGAGLLAGALGVPVPEEIVLAVGGAAAQRAHLPLLPVYVFAWAVIVLLDLGLHTLGGALGPRLKASRWGRRIRPERWQRLEALVERRGVHAVVLARFVMGARIPVFLLAGALGMPRRRFLLAVSLAALVSVALPVALGYVFAQHMGTVLDALGRTRWIVLGAVLVPLLAWWATRRRP